MRIWVGDFWPAGSVVTKNYQKGKKREKDIRKSEKLSSDPDPGLLGIRSSQLYISVHKVHQYIIRERMCQVWIITHIHST